MREKRNRTMENRQPERARFPHSTATPLAGPALREMEEWKTPEDERRGKNGTKPRGPDEDGR